MAETGSNYCSLPFVHTAIEANGDVKACCLTPPFQVSPGEYFNLNKHSLNEVLSSPDFQNFLQTFRKNQRHPYCEQCWFDDDSGTKSNRKKFTELTNRWFGEAQDPFARNLQFLEIKVGNRCNLKCRICGPHNSSKAAEEQFQISGDKRVLEPTQLSAWIDLDEVWNQLAQLDLRVIHIMGGEPLLDRAHLKLLRSLIASGRSREIVLWYNTNGTVWPADFFEIWKEFKAIHISISLDDFGPRYEYQRFPAKWTIAEKNLIQFYQAASEGKLEAGLDICWSLFNIYYVDEIITHFEGLFRANSLELGNPIAHGHHYYVGPYYCPKTMRPEERARFIQRLQQSRYRDDGKYGPLIQRLMKHLEYDNFTEGAEHSRFERIFQQDRYRHQKFIHTFPEIKFLMEKDITLRLPNEEIKFLEGQIV